MRRSVVAALVFRMISFGSLLFLPAASNVQAQELPFTFKPGVGARSAGMGFAYSAVAEDGSALYYNPAGLAQIRRIELSGGIVHSKQTQDVGFRTGIGLTTQSVDVGTTEPNHLSLVYPFPTYRGSLVLGLAFQRANSLKSDYFRTGVIRQPSGEVPGLIERESFTNDGEINFWTAGIAGDVSPHVSLGASVSYIQGSTVQDFLIGRLRLFPNGFTDIDSSNEVFTFTDKENADITGWTGSVGLLAHASELTRIGLTVDLPQVYHFDGNFRTDLLDQVYDTWEERPYSDKVTLPFSFLAGVAFTPRNLILAADARFTDWTEIDFEGPITVTDSFGHTQSAYRSTLGLNVGIEYQLPATPARFRAGFSSQPLPYRLIPGAVKSFHYGAPPDSSYFSRGFPVADINTDRYFVTVGAGTLIDNTVSVDLAYVRGMYKRSAESISEKWTDNRVFGTASFRF